MKIRLVIPLILVTFTLSGCFLRLFNTEEQYEFRQNFDHIVSIEILKIDSDYKANVANVVRNIDPTLHREVVNGLLEISGGRVGLDPPEGLGVYIFRITYQDGECELIGNYSNGYVTPDGSLHTKNYSFERKSFYELISHFLGTTVTG